MRILKQFVERISGSRQQWYRRLFPLYGSWKKRQLDVRIRKEQKKVLYRVGGCAIALLICTGMALFSQEEQKQISRIEWEQIRKEGGTVALEYDGIVREILLDPLVEPELTKESEEEHLREARNVLSREMLGNNPDWDHISGKLKFPQNLDSGVYVRYETSDPQRISAEGLVDGIGTGDGVPVQVSVTMILGASMEQYIFEGTVVPPRTPEEVSQALQLRGETMRQNEAMDDIGEEINVLTAKKDGSGWIFVIMIAGLMGIMIAGRFSEVEKEREQHRKTLAEELPLLMDQLILMMNAGLILSEALETASLSTTEEGTLQSDLGFLCQRAKETKRPVVSLLCEYAAETGCPEFVRFSVMLADHVNRGSSSLVQQLKMERNFAMESQWKQKEGRYRTMEVQLAGPLFLLFGVILLVSIGPVMIGI